jgi:hypothetical protein
MFLREREAARVRGDRGVERCMNVELGRMGYTVPSPAETATLDEPKENTAAVRGRPKRAKPRCEHGRPPERCEDCAEE